MLLDLTLSTRSRRLFSLRCMYVYLYVCVYNVCFFFLYVSVSVSRSCELRSHMCRCTSICMYVSVLCLRVFYFREPTTGLVLEQEYILFFKFLFFYSFEFPIYLSNFLSLSFTHSYAAYSLASFSYFAHAQTSH